VFKLDPSLDRIPVSPDAIERVAWSLNLTSVAGKDFAGAEARAYAVTSAAGGGRSVCHVCLYVPSLERVQVFRHEKSPFPKAEGQAHQEEALAFLEDLGFILESVEYGGWGSRERQAWFEKQPPFHRRVQAAGTRSTPVDSDATLPGIPAVRPAGPPPATDLPPEMEGLQTLADPIEGSQGPPSAPPRQTERGARTSRAEAVAPPSPPPPVEAEPEPVAPPETAGAPALEGIEVLGEQFRGEQFQGSLAAPPSDEPREDAIEATQLRAGTVPQAAPTPPAEPQAPLEMEGLLILGDPVETSPPAPSPPPRRAAQGAPRSRARAAVGASPSEAVEPEGRAASGRPVKVDLHEEYEDLARLFASL
jgi:hypothetical protein